jgi:hypothetical protein
MAKRTVAKNGENGNKIDGARETRLAAIQALIPIALKAVAMELQELGTSPRLLLDEILPFRITQEGLQVPGHPKFGSVFGVGFDDMLEFSVQLKNKFMFH